MSKEKFENIIENAVGMTPEECSTVRKKKEKVIDLLNNSEINTIYLYSTIRK